MAHPADGPKPIERIAVGDRLWAFDLPNLRWVERPVAEIFRNQNEGPMATIRVAGETIRATGGHPFWVVDGVDLAERRLPERIAAVEPGGSRPGRWVLAMDLRVGDVVPLRGGEFSRLDSVEVDETEETVYNFRVHELENYAVGACGVLVHNTNEGVTGGENATPSPTPPVPDPIYRGGMNRTPRLGVDVKAASDGLIHPLAKNGKPQGISLNIDPKNKFIQQYGGAFSVEGVPDGLQILQSGQAGHYVVAPKSPMSFEAYAALCEQLLLRLSNKL